MLARVRVPASSANLGPGFDSFGLALALHNTFEAESADEWRVEVTGFGAGELPVDGTNDIARSMARVFNEVGEPERRARIRCMNRIPSGHGLGSSAAAIVGGLLLADRLCGARLDKTRLLELAAELEGHPDNVAAALFGGMTIAWQDESVRATRVEPACGLAAVVVMADAPLATRDSRDVLPAEVPHGDAARNAARSGVLVAGMLQGDPQLIAAGLDDRLHQPYRERVVSDLAELGALLVDAGALGAVLSGAGPTVIGLVAAPDDDAAEERASEIAEHGSAGVSALPGRRHPAVLRIDRDGAAVD
jgi:homoserine kinase